MANGFKVFAVGEVLTAADVNDYLMEQSIGIFANSTARDAQITSPIEGQFCYLADSNVLQFYNGSSWSDFIGEGDISSVVAGTNLSGGGVSGAVTLNLAIDSAVAFADQTASAIILKDYAETDVTVSYGTDLAINLANGNTGSVTLTGNVSGGIDFTNVPTNGVSTFTLKVTQDGTGGRTMDIDEITVNGGGHVTALTQGNAGLTLTSTANAVDLVTFLFYDAGTPLINALLDFRNS
jgi:hypothetical protein